MTLDRAFEGCDWASKITVDEYCSLVKETFPEAKLYAAQFVVQYLVLNRQLFVYGNRPIPSPEDDWARKAPPKNDAWLRALADCLVYYLQKRKPDTFAEICPFWPSDDGENRALEAAARDLQTRLYRLANGLGLVRDAENRTFDFRPPFDLESVEAPRLILPAYRTCPRCGGKLEKDRSGSCDADPRTTVVIDHRVYANAAAILSAQCTNKDCRVTVSADRTVLRVNSRSAGSDDDADQKGRLAFYHNAAIMIRITRNLWADRRFTSHVVSQTQHQRASGASASRVALDDLSGLGTFPPSAAARCFLEETIRRVATERGKEFSVFLGKARGAENEWLAEAAYRQLADEGRLPGLDGHRCSGCCTPAPELNDDNDDDDMDVEEGDATDILRVLGTPNRHRGQRSYAALMIDSTYMGPKLCAISDCPNALEDYGRNPTEFCRRHFDVADQCRRVGCDEPVATDEGLSFFCDDHRDLEAAYIKERDRRKRSDSRLYSGRSRNEPSQKELDRRQAASELYRNPHFGARRSYAYCVLSYPCGLIKRCIRLPDREDAESIQDVLVGSFAEEEEKPTHIFSDKACLLLKYLATERTQHGKTLWEEHWKESTRFMLDPFHAKAHLEHDVVCQRHARPEEVLQRDDPGKLWNTSIAEQINNQLGAYSFSTDSMTRAYWDWFMFAIAYLMNCETLGKQAKKEGRAREAEQEEKRKKRRTSRRERQQQREGDEQETL